MPRRRFFGAIGSRRLVKPFNAFDDSIRKNRRAVLANHAIAITWTGPFRQGSPFLGGIYKTLEDFAQLRRIEDRDQRETVVRNASQMPMSP